MDAKTSLMRRIRSFVRRDSRQTKAQQRAVTTYWPQYGLDANKRLDHFSEVFQREAPCWLEIGFGTGHSLLAAAIQNPQKNFIGVETHLPGIGTLLAGIVEQGVTNIRIYHADAVMVFTDCLSNQMLDGIQIFFPDPWPKRRHHKRRLIQPAFVAECLAKLKPEGMLHLATDWEDYAKHMMSVLSAFPELENIAGSGQYAERSEQRPLITRFEKRGEQAGHVIRELAFRKK